MKTEWNKETWCANVIQKEDEGNEVEGDENNDTSHNEASIRRLFIIRD